MKKFTSVMQLIKKEKGATSIFVMILMVVLVVFGLAALTTSLASLKLSGKNTMWTKEYYLLESAAETNLALIDQQLIAAEEDARLEIDISGSSSSFSDLYFEQAIINLKKLSEENPEINILADKKLVTFSVKENKEAYPKNISVILEILAPAYDESLKNEQARFSIIQWKEWQNNFEYDQDIDFENPNFENPNFETIE